MIIVRLYGGLGNQLFQYAAGRRLSILHGTVLKLDVSWFAKYALRRYSLGPFRIAAEFATPEDIASVTGADRRGLTRRLHRLRRHLKPYYRQARFSEPRSGPFDPHFLKTPPNVYLDGYWQSEKYFQGIQDVIREEFSLIVNQDPKSRKVAERIAATESVSIHVRRGDYVSNPNTNRHHGTCEPEYYRRAIQLLMEKVAVPHAFIFSDEPDWAAENLALGCPATAVAHNGAERDYEDLRLMGLCKHHIIANSSFSWWGAWLANRSRKTVVAPHKWFSERDRDTTDLIPDDWIRL